MSSGYCSLDEDLEDCFFTAKTSFFRSTPSKVSAKVTAEKKTSAKGCAGWEVGALLARGEMPVFLHVWLQVLPKLACGWSGGRAAGGEEGSTCLLQAPRAVQGVCTAAGFSQPRFNLLRAGLAPSRVEEPTPKCGFAALGGGGGAGSNPASCRPWVRLLARDLWFGLAKYAPLVKIAPDRWAGRWESYSIKLIRKLTNTATNLLPCLGARICLGGSAWLGSVSPQDEISVSVTLTRLLHGFFLSVY